MGIGTVAHGFATGPLFGAVSLRLLGIRSCFLPLVANASLALPEGLVPANIESVRHGSRRDFTAGHRKRI
jgi:hypothetical protein